MLKMTMHIRKKHTESPLSVASVILKRKNKIRNEDLSINEASISLDERPEEDEEGKQKSAGSDDKITFICEEPDCSFETQQKSYIQDHVKNVHGDKCEVSFTAQDLNFVCGQCRKEFYEETFQSHLKTHEIPIIKIEDI